MDKKLVFAALLIFAPTAATAVDNLGGCGWGSKLFDGKRGLVSNIFAATSNSSYGTNTFGMSSGTSGCTQDGVVRSNWKTAMFIDGNKEKLARDMSNGGGETMESLVKLIGVQDQHKAAFFRLTKNNLAHIFASDNSKTDQVIYSLKQVLAADKDLAPYARAI